ncbi:MAG: outer membrane protein assembly factor BamD [Alphaproteobacteria bacterium]|nr:outer membrane protein assembly factor BamD [Alphaproteobacteria bacterium]
MAVLRLVAPLLALLLLACAEKPEPYVEKPVEELYNTALSTLEERLYLKAARQFEEVERQHPYSAWATKAQLMAAFSFYQANKYDDAIGALDQFIELHPSNRDAPYAYYLKGLSYYEQIADIGRDQEITDRALKALDEVVRRFPESRYARDAILKIDLTRNHLAGKEMEIGRYYLTRGQYLAAINRFRRVVDNYQTTEQVPEALLRLTEAYLALGIRDEALAAAAVLGHNYPGSDWYRDAYALVQGQGVASGNGQKGWFGRTFGSFF